MGGIYESKFDLGQEPTQEEWEIYKRVSDYCRKENVADWIEDEHPEATQEQFEKTYEIYYGMWGNDGEHDWEMIQEAYWGAERELSKQRLATESQ